MRATVSGAAAVRGSSSVPLSTRDTVETWTFSSCASERKVTGDCFPFMALVPLGRMIAILPRYPNVRVNTRLPRLTPAHTVQIERLGRDRDMDHFMHQLIYGLSVGSTYGMHEHEITLVFSCMHTN